MTHRYRRPNAPYRVLILALFFTCVIHAAAAAPKAAGKLGRVDGTVEHWSATFPDKGWRTVNPGHDIYEGDKLRTVGRSTANVWLNVQEGPSSVYLTPDTLVEFPDSRVPKKEKGAYDVLLELKDGLVRLWTGAPHKLPETVWDIRTPTAVLGSRPGPKDGIYNNKYWMWGVRHHRMTRETVLMSLKGNVGIATHDGTSETTINGGQKITADKRGIGKREQMLPNEWDEAVTALLGPDIAQVRGVWNWPIGKATFSVSGQRTGVVYGTVSCAGNPNVKSGTWSSIDAATIRIVWDGGKYTDTMTLSGDGNTLSGQNQNGYRFSASRAN